MHPTITEAAAAVEPPVRVRAHHRSVRHVGADWTTSRHFDVRASHGSVVIDLLLPELGPGEIEVDLDVERSTVKLLVPGGARIDAGDLRRRGRGRVEDWTGTGTPDGRPIRLVGELRNAEVRIHRGGVAILGLLFTRRTRAQVRQAHREGRLG